ncbi:pilin [Patescibacteria group bacterium]|nr:pilin [Patescibacteria group bacterium]
MGLNLSPSGQFAGLSYITIAKIISAFVIFSMIIASLAFLFMLITGGIKWMLAGGKSEKVDEAKAQLMNAFIGILIVFAAWAIVNLVSLFFGIEMLSFDIPTINP